MIEYVGMVLRYDLSMDASYILGHGIDCRCDIPVESFVVLSPGVRQVEHGHKDRPDLPL